MANGPVLELMLTRLTKIEQALLALRMDQRAARSATLTLPEAALYLGLRTKSGQPNVSAVRALCRRRMLPFSKPGKAILIRRADLDRLLERTVVRHPLQAVGT
jgi:excisionase family DNA binding protein